jgi:hypothetical protein
MTPQTRRIPDALLDRYLADSLDAAERDRLETRMADSPLDRARLDELRADSAAFLIQHPAGPLVARFEEEQRRARWWRWPALLFPVLAAATAAVLVFVRPVQPVDPIEPDPPYTVKGLALLLYRKTPEGSAPFHPSKEALVPGDSIRFEVKGSESGYIAIVSRDERGVTVYYPYGGATAAPYQVDQAVLPGAIELDDTLGREDVYALHSKHPFELGWALQALRERRDIRDVAPKDVTIGHIFFLKSSSRELR